MKPFKNVNLFLVIVFLFFFTSPLHAKDEKCVINREDLPWLVVGIKYEKKGSDYLIKDSSSFEFCKPIKNEEEKKELNEYYERNKNKKDKKEYEIGLYGGIAHRKTKKDKGYIVDLPNGKEVLAILFSFDEYSSEGNKSVFLICENKGKELILNSILDPKDLTKDAENIWINDIFQISPEDLVIVGEAESHFEDTDEGTIWLGWWKKPVSVKAIYKDSWKALKNETMPMPEESFDYAFNKKELNIKVIRKVRLPMPPDSKDPYSGWLTFKEETIDLIPEIEKLGGKIDLKKEEENKNNNEKAQKDN
ncbi:MAG: hypothetical protein ACMUHX_00865 [bacterium]